MWRAYDLAATSLRLKTGAAGGQPVTVGRMITSLNLGGARLAGSEIFLDEVVVYEGSPGAFGGRIIDAGASRR